MASRSERSAADRCAGGRGRRSRALPHPRPIQVRRPILSKARWTLALILLTLGVLSGPWLEGQGWPTTVRSVVFSLFIGATVLVILWGRIRKRREWAVGGMSVPFTGARRHGNRGVGAGASCWMRAWQRGAAGPEVGAGPSEQQRWARRYSRSSGDAAVTMATACHRSAVTRCERLPARTTWRRPVRLSLRPCPPVRAPTSGWRRWRSTRRRWVTPRPRR